MAVPFNVPDGEDDSQPSQQVNAQSSPPVTPTRPVSIPIPNRSSWQSQLQSSSAQSSPQHSLDNEMLVQAFYEALCRCSQINTPTSPTFSQQGQFWYPPPSSTASHSNASSPRNSFRSFHRRRLNSYGSQSQYSQQSEDFPHEHHDLGQWEQHYQQRDELEEFPGQIQPKADTQAKASENGKQKKSKKDNKITNFVISALQFVIDTLK